MRGPKMHGDRFVPLPEEKPGYVRRMFGDIARQYDLMNRLMTGGQDRLWRRLTVESAELPDGGKFLDVATGTGDMLCEVLHQQPNTLAVGLDFTPGMLAVGRKKCAGTGAQFTMGDALDLPFPDDTFDATVSGFMMRNVADIARAFSEQRRVVKPGGKVVCLEITRPAIPLWKDVFRFYFFKLVPILGGMISGRRSAYTYLPHSTVDFPAPDELEKIMESVELRHVKYRTLTMGTVALHVGVK